MMIVTGFISVFCLVGLAQAVPRGKRTPSHGAGSMFEFHCDGRPDGYYADRARQCHQYYICKDGQIMSVKFCGIVKNYDVFSEKVNACVRKEDYTCPPASETHMTVPAGCEGKNEDDLFPNLDNNCRSFFRCVHNKKLEFNCGEGTIFSEKDQACVHEGDYECPKAEKDVRAINEEKVKILKRIQILLDKLAPDA